MKKQFSLSVFIVVLSVWAFAQKADEKPAMVFENLYIMPKHGMEDKFEAAVKAHDDKYHPDGPYKAGLRKVEYGEKAGWYVWVFGPASYAALDTRPDKDNGHNEDWSKNVDALVDSYGSVSLWQFNPDLSSGIDNMKNTSKYEVWAVDLKRGEYYRFKALCEKLKKAYDSMPGTSFLVYNNPVHTPKDGDVALLWGFNTYNEWYNDPGPKEAFEKIYGTGSWQNLLDEWNDIIVDYSSEIRSRIN